MDNWQLFEEASPVLEKIEEAGFEAYFVGGSVRDYLLKRPIDDVDIATSALPEEIKEIFHKTIDVGIEHGTVLVRWQGESYEITTFRTESEYEDFRHPNEVTFVRSLQDDLKRRDFTMNAIAMDRKGNIIDPYNGQRDIQNEIITTVGCAKERFSEDALRMMRAARFVSQLGFQLQEATYQSLEKYTPLLKHIAVERKLNEFEKLLDGPFKHRGLQLIVQTGLYRFLPGLLYEKEALQTLITFECTKMTNIQMWMILTDRLQVEEPTSFLKNWRLPTKKIKYILNGISLLEKRKKESWKPFDLYEYGLSLVLDVENIYSITFGKKNEKGKLLTWNDELPLKSRKDLAITGNDLLNWSRMNGGPWVKEWIEAIEKAIISGEVKNEKESIREWLKSCKRM
ncbi:tRNA nucleotidyltransferase (CCA-adding enzyme) [Oikeobacillus pervagus]|uniref:CCA-adding enzyme n=1 Tax=Oikeobacillus pervagus TaxID=1325931 RepID=A0AAJ1SXQ2_9BACI|nr:CCA tRNA nucleotidyltransferase [Oikeobacillus pervagus]MDQ0213672.1 tRNA nucleotidyltransferase (CCA-adding enzyme) [Oikeobacillus pervagus]